MANQKAPALKSTNLWTGIATLIAAIFSYFSLTPDLASADVLAGEAARAVEAIQTRNWIFLVTVAVNVGNILYHLFVKKS